jgi:hypothetical protein
MAAITVVLVNLLQVTGVTMKVLNHKQNLVTPAWDQMSTSVYGMFIMDSKRFTSNLWL